LRTQLGFHRRQRQVGLVFLFLFLLNAAFAADIGDVVVVARAAAAPRLLGLGLLVLVGPLHHGSLLGLGAGIGGFEIDDLAQERLALVEVVAPDDDGLESQRALAQARDHGLAAGLDALGDGDLALARQKFHRTHLAQIHAHGVVSAV